MKWILSVAVILIACKEPRNASNKAIPIDTVIWKMNARAMELLDQLTTDSAKVYLASYEDTVKQINNNRLSLYWALQKGQLFDIDQVQDSLKIYSEKALHYLGSEGITSKDSLNFYIVFDKLIKDQGLLDSALKAANEAYYLARRIDTSRITTTSFDLSVMYHEVDDLANVRKYLFEAWKHSDQEPELKGLIGNGIAYYYDRIGKVDSAIYFFKNFEKDSANIAHPDMLADMYENSAIFLIEKNKLNEGLPYLLRAKKIRDSLGDKNIITYINLGQTYGNMKQFSKANEYLDSARGLAELQNDYNHIKMSWKIRAEVYAKIPDYKKAYAALDSAFTHASIEMDSSLQKHSRELETKYAVREKDNAIKSLAFTNEANLKIRNQQNVIIITIIAFSLLLGLVGLLLWRRRREQMLRRENNLRQQVLRAQMEPHFIFNALSVLQNLIRTGVIEKSIGYLSNLAKLMRFNFENASKTFVSLQGEIEALEAYLNLQMVYHPGLFTYSMHVYNNYEEEDVFIPPMLLQPVVENSIQHGFSQINYNGFIEIKIERRSNSIFCTIEDNGKGFHSVKENNKPHAIEINQKRLSILAKQTRLPASFKIFDKNSGNEQQGVRVEIEIPIQFNKRDAIFEK